MLTSEDLTRILKEIVQGVEHPENDTKAMAAYREKVRADVAKIHANGGIVEIPFT